MKGKEGPGTRPRAQRRTAMNAAPDEKEEGQ